MTVIPFPRKVIRVHFAPTTPLPATLNALAVARAVAPVQAEVSTATSLLADMMSAALAGAPMSEMELGNAELIRALLQASAHACARSTRKEDRELHWHLLRHLRLMDATPPP